MYKIEGSPDVLVHSYYEQKNDKFVTDIEDRFYKYYFEKWQDEEKDKFVVNENYEDYKYKSITEKGWMLTYSTYIEVNNYDELISATNAIIRFINYMPYPALQINSYIKVGNQLILPHNVSPQSDEEIMQSAITQYENISK